MQSEGQTSPEQNNGRPLSSGPAQLPKEMRGADRFLVACKRKCDGAKRRVAHLLFPESDGTYRPIRTHCASYEELVHSRQAQTGRSKSNSMLIVKDPYEEVLEEMKSIHEAKNADYGGSAWKTYQEYGMVSYLVRLADKLHRATSLVRTNERRVKDEKLYDTLLDMANYAAMAASEIKNHGEGQGSEG